MTEALVTPQLLKWARERRHFSVHTAANKVNVEPHKLDAWEKGQERPTLRQAQSLAQTLNVPFGYLFLSIPPIEKLPLPDFRTVTGTPSSTPSPEFADVLNDALRKQEWYHDYQKSEGAHPIAFIGRFTRKDNAEMVAADIRKALRVNDDMRRHSQNWEQFLSEFVRRVENAGVLVLRSGIVGTNTYRKLDVQEFRGFAISDNLSPLIFINAQDAKAAQIFTLAHELAHLWIGESGISNPDYTKRSSQQQHLLDRFCDQIAAETLVPNQDFLSRWQDKRPLEDNLQILATLYKVSEFVVLRRAYDNDKVSHSEYEARFQKLLDRGRRKLKDGGGDFYRALLVRNSNTLTLTLLSAVSEGRLSHRDAAQLLSVKLKTLIQVQKNILGTAFANA
ncbi:MAG: ImmA/IrrE family metallo-endopeptidase [Chloroflexi bacterium]|nr:ImmA/IrrE family metallo-endopeptidase [Chloroflexota bacterium]